MGAFRPLYFCRKYNVTNGGFDLQIAYLVVDFSLDTALMQLRDKPKVQYSDVTMNKQPFPERDPLPESFASLEKAGEFWDTHDSGDYEDLMEDVTFEISLTGKSTYYVAVAKDIATALRTIARQQGVSTQTLINLWLQEKLLQARNNG
jgi:hypothetical protein